MSGLLKASSIIQPAYLSPHRKRRNPLPFLSCKTHHRNRGLESLGLKSVDRITGRRPPGIIRRCTILTTQLLPVSFSKPEEWLTSVNLVSTVLQLSSTLKAMPAEALGTSSPPSLSSDLTDSTLPVMTHPLLNFLLEAYSAFHAQTLVAATILAAIIVVATFVARSNKEIHLKQAENSLVFVSHPSQFNRFVSMRCPSMSTNRSRKIEVLEKIDMQYQRMCLHAPDGGIVAIDWPAELDFVTEENNLVNTLLLVPGTTEGSEDEGVKQFVIDAVRYGYFPVVLNPRGCASSPVTTARVFSGADSDDVRLAVQHIVSERPGSTLMGVGWGWGANMLTKYLGEETRSTSLMAAVAISNPFDLQQSSMFLGMTNAGQLDRLMANSLVSILESNKVLFVGQSKGFDLRKALASTSVREFDTAISRVTHGFDTLEEFYSAASSARYINSVQVPLLCVQGEDFSMPVTSIPYSILEANPYTTALVAQISASNSISAKAVVREPGSASRHDWSHKVAFEWLAAVEVALLKGQHPLLNIVNSDYSESKLISRVQPSVPNNVSIEGKDISRSPKDSKMDFSVEALNGENTLESEDEDKSMQEEKWSVPSKAEKTGGNEAVEENDAAKSTEKGDLNSEAERSLSKTKSSSLEIENTSLQAESASSKAKSIPPEVESTLPEPTSSPPDEGEPEEAAEAIQMRAAAESVMNVLDITMPGTLSDEKKAQVLTAVGEGESVLTALQEAVPEDVRGSMAAAVSGAVQARGLSFNMVGFGKSMPPPSLPAGLIESIKGKMAAVSGGKKESIPPTPHLPVDSSNSIGLGDTHSPQAASGGKVDGEGHAEPVTNNNELQKSDNQGAKFDGDKDVGSEDVASDVGKEDNVVKPEDKSQSGGRNHSKEDSSKDSKESKSVESKDSTESKPLEGKHEETVDKHEGVKQTDDKNKVGAEKAPVGEVVRKEDKKQGDTADNNGSTNAKDERKPVDKHEGVEQTEDKNKDGAEEAPVSEVLQKEDKKQGDTADNNRSTNAKEETKPAEEGEPSPVTPGPAAAAGPHPPSPSLENIPPPAPPDPITGVAPPLDMRLAFQALTGFDDSTQMAVTNVFGVVEGMLEKLEQEQEQKAATQDASVDAEEATGNQEKNSVKGYGKEEDDSTVVGDSPPEHNEEDGAAKTAAMTDIDLKNADDGDDGLDTHETAKSKDSEIAVEVVDKNQDTDNKTKKQTTSVLETPKQLKDNRDNSVQLSSSKLLNQSIGQRPQSKVMMIKRVGSCTLVQPMLKEQPLKARTDFCLPSVNGAASKDRGASIVQKGSETQQSGQSVREPDSMKPVFCKMTLDQLSQEVDQERRVEKDDASVGVNELHNDQTIEVEATEIKETKGPNMIENMVKDALKLEILRRLGVAGMETLGIDLEQEVANVAISVAESVQRWKKEPSTDGSSAGKLGILPSGSVINTLGTVMGGTHILGGLVPVGVLAGVILASLGAVYLIVTDNQQDDEGDIEKVDDEEDMAGDEEEDEEASDNDSDSNHSLWHRLKVSALDVPVLSVNRHSEGTLNASELGEDPEVVAAKAVGDDVQDEDGDNSESEGSSDDEDRAENNNQGKIMGMMAAAVTGGASLAGMSTANRDSAAKQDGQDTEGYGKNMGNEREKAGIISSIHPLAEKALSVAAPVVPHKEDGEIDHERLVAMLAELGQRGGFLRLIGKVALLWGGLRGAMSLTERLLVFLQMNKRHLHYRLVGFAAMTLLLWSPVLIPVLPSLLHQWATKAPGGVADAASVVGLYGAILILVTIWGRRVRGYSKPLLYYGLRLWSKRKVQDLGLGLALGGGLVSFLYGTNFILGYVQFNWGALLATKPKLPGTVGVTLFTAAKVSKLVVQAVGIGLAVSLVEEVLFRAWLQEEIAVDLGFHWAVFISAVAFALVHWSAAAMPGLWFLSVGLAGARAKMNRNLAFPIGLHGGLVAVNYVMTVGGLVQYMPHAPTWFTGAHVGNPLGGALGTAMMALLAVTLYPRTITHPLMPSKEVEHAV